MRRWGVLAALTVLVIAATVAIASARSLYQVVLPAPAEETLVLTSEPNKFRFIDVNDNGRENVGDMFLFRTGLADDAGEPAGVGHVRCVAHFRALVCEGVFTLSGGQVVVHGRAGETETFDVPVTGGSGDFADVGGQLHVEATGEGGTETLTLSLYHFAT